MVFANIGEIALQSSTSSGAGGGIALMLVLLFYFAVLAVMVAAMWKVHEKAGEPGWACLIPIYNVYILLKIAERPAWWLILYLIPIVSLIPAILIPMDIADKFGKSGGFGLGLVFLPFIFFPILGFGDAEYQGDPDYRP